MQPGIYIARDEDGLFLAELTDDGHWLVFGYTLAVPVQPDEIVAGPLTPEQIRAGVT